MTADFKQLCRDLMDALDSGIPGTRIQNSPLAERARAALAEPDELMIDRTDDLRRASADVSGVEVLSPAAQAILDAAVTAYDDEYLYTLPMTRHAGAVAAAALRAAADLVLPEEPLYGGDQRWMYERDARQSCRKKLLTIADELEGQQ